MILRYYGHSLFTMTLENGTIVLTDPYGDFYNYPKRTLRADIVTMSHHHHDHDAIAMVEGSPQVIDQLGVYLPAADVVITGLASKHDDQNGAKRGENIIYILEIEGMHVVHLGDLGHVLTESQRLSIGKVDVLLTPVGGTYTTDAVAAAENVRLLKPQVTIPMHYKTPFDPEMPIQTEQPFLEKMHVSPQPMPLCRLTARDIGERPPVVLLTVTSPNQP